MIDLTQLTSRWGRGLALTSGRSLLIAFWSAFVVSAVADTLLTPLSGVLSALGQFFLAVIWIGYPIWLFHCFAKQKSRVIGVLLMACGVLVGYGLSVFVYDRNGPPARSVVAPVVGAALIVVPFVVGAHALKDGEQRAKVGNTASVGITALSLFAFPFLGSYVHERFRRAFSLLQGLSH
jgi:hypothetical protein